MAIYMMREVQPITIAWIYHNANLWLISLSSDWTNWLTIADKNLWATSTDVSSSASYWNVYQWGNNYWRNYPDTFTSSTSTVNASSYWPNNYYSNSTYRYKTNISWWDSSYNKNLRWDTTNTLAARRWPCDEWWHIPTLQEVIDMCNIWVSLWAWNTSSYNWYTTYLFMPFNYTLSPLWLNAPSWRSINYISWRTSSASGNWMAKLFMRMSGEVRQWQGTVTTSDSSIRPFKNEAVQPDSSRTKLY